MFCPLYSIFHMYYSSNIYSSHEIWQISALIFSNFQSKELEGEYLLKTSLSPHNLDVMKQFFFFLNLSLCSQELSISQWTPSKLSDKIFFGKQLLVFQSMLEKFSVLWLEINALKSFNIKTNYSLINSFQSFPTWSVKTFLWKQQLST